MPFSSSSAPQSQKQTQTIRWLSAFKKTTYYSKNEQSTLPADAGETTALLSTKSFHTAWKKSRVAEASSKSKLHPSRTCANATRRTALSCSYLVNPKKIENQWLCVFLISLMVHKLSNALGAWRGLLGERRGALFHGTNVTASSLQ